MPPRKRPSSSAVNARSDYESDDGFVEDAPRSKKAKTTQPRKLEKGGAAGAGMGASSVGKDGEVFWELSGKRRVGVSVFKGNLMVNIREYYEKDGEMLPGKKGISLPIEQFNTLISLLPQVEQVLVEKGEKIERPDYNGAEAPSAMADDEEEPEPDVKVKKNFEETSDED